MIGWTNIHLFCGWCSYFTVRSLICSSFLVDYILTPMQPVAHGHTKPYIISKYVSKSNLNTGPNNISDVFFQPATSCVWALELQSSVHQPRTIDHVISCQLIDVTYINFGMQATQFLWCLSVYNPYLTAMRSTCDAWDAPPKHWLFLIPQCMYVYIYSVGY